MIYYNEFDLKKAAMLKQLMTDGLIPMGDIDTRSIKDVKPDDLRNYIQCHFFAGIGLWTLALKIAWGGVAASTRPVWTGSCPCQPYSSAGKQKAQKDDRHLWPEWFRLIKECRPAKIFGEQVANAITKGWLDGVYDDLEGQDYAVGSAVLPACSVGAPHKRDRLWFVADSDKRRWKAVASGRQSGKKYNLESCGIMADAGSAERRPDTERWRNVDDGANARREEEAGGFAICGENILGNSDRQTSERNTGSLFGKKKKIGGEGQQDGNIGDGFTNASSMGNSQEFSERKPDDKGNSQPISGETRSISGSSGYWGDNIEFISCPDGKARAVEPRIPLLAHGYPARVPILHAIGDGIVPEVAAQFIIASS